MKKLVLILFLLIIYCTKDSNVSGVVDDTDTGIVIYMKDGKTPARGATVKFIPSGFAQNIELNKSAKTMKVWETTTDSNGTFTIPDMPDSTYNLIIEKDSLKAMQKEVGISSGENEIVSDTLEQTGSFSAYVVLQPNDMVNVQSVYVQILGTDVEFRNMDKRGMFSFEDLAPGRYRLRFETNLPDYSTTFREITIESGVDTVLSDTIEILYSGIDVVSNVWSEYDTATGVITLHWNATEYSDLLDYVIYRDKGTATTYSNAIYASVMDTLFCDTIYDVTRDSGTNSAADTLSYSYKYRVAIRNNSTDIGNTYGVTTVTAYPPLLVQPDILLKVLDTIVRPHDTVRIAVTVKNTSRGISKLLWYANAEKKSVDSLILKKPARTLNDTFVTSFNSVKKYMVSVEVTDDADAVWTKSITVDVKAWEPVANAGGDTNVSISDSVYLQGTAEDNGAIMGYAWKIGDEEWFSVESGDTFFIAPDKPGTVICSLKVVDDDDQTGYDALQITVTDIAPVVDAGKDLLVGIGEEIHLQPTASDDGKIERYEWRFGNDDWVQTSSGDTTVIAPLQEGTYTCAVRVTDDDGRSLSDAVNFTVSLFTPSTITTSASGAVSVYALDVDGDGDVDVLSASESDNAIRWYENDGTQSFTVRTITTSAWGASSVYALDVDSDGDVDVLSASSGDNAIRWYEDDGSQSFTARTITTSAKSAYSVYALDMDGDGDVDVLSASVGDDAIRWYENDGSQSFTVRTITTSAVWARSVFAQDVDGDGDIDVLSASQGDDAIRWYEKDGSQTFTARTITTSAKSAYSVYAQDVDGDGDIDVLSASAGDDAIRWYENDGSQSFIARTITTSADGAQSVYAQDVDGDGDVDVLSASNYDNEIRWYENHQENLAKK